MVGKLLVEEARRYLGVEEVPRGSNRGPEIDYWLLEAFVAVPKGQRLGAPWCMAFVWCMGRQALGHRWPVPRTASVQAVHDWAKRAGCLEPTGGEGDLLLLWHQNLGRYAHVAIVTGGVTAYTTVEGNTNPGGSRDGWGVYARERKATASTAFVRWSSMLRD